MAHVTAMLLVLSLPALAGWQEELSPPAPGDFQPLHPLHAKFKFGWTAFTAAEATVDYARAKGGLMRMSVNGKTTGFVRTLWRLDAHHSALMQPVTLHPISVVQTEIYRAQSVKLTLDYTPEGVTRLREVTPPDPKPPKPKHFAFANVLDLNSALQWVRSQPLRAGDRYKFVVCPAGTPYLAEVDVDGMRKIGAAHRSWDAIKLDLKLWRIDDNLSLKEHTKFKQGSAWFSNDANRILLRFEAELLVGSVWMELDSIEFKP